MCFGSLDGLGGFGLLRGRGGGGGEVAALPGDETEGGTGGGAEQQEGCHRPADDGGSAWGWHVAGNA